METNRRNEVSALFLMGIVAFLYSTTGLFVHFAHDEGLPAFQLALFRSIFSSIVASIGMIRNGNHFFGPPSCRFWVLARGVTGGIGFLSYFQCLSTLPLGDAVALMTLYPVVSVFMGSFFLHEAIHPFHLVATGLCGAGAIMISKSSFIFSNDIVAEEHAKNFFDSALSGYIAAAVTTLSGGSGFIFVRLAKEASSLSLTFSNSIFAVVYCSAAAITVDFQWQFSSWCIFSIFAVCLLGTIAHVLLNYAGQRAPAGLSAIVCSTDILWAYLWQTTVFLQPISKMTVIGVFTIILGVVLIALQKLQNKNCKSLSFLFGFGHICTKVNSNHISADGSTTTKTEDYVPVNLDDIQD